MNITIICEVLGEPNNGTSIAAYTLINYMKKHGHHVNVVCPDQNRIGEEGFYVLPLKHFPHAVDDLIRRNQVVLPRFDEKIIYEACKDADVVHMMMPLFMSRKTSKYIVNVMHKPLTAGFHAQVENFSSQIGMMNSLLVNHIVYRWYDHNVYVRCKAIHYPTQFIQEIFEKERHRKTPGYVISNGVNPFVRSMKVEKKEEYKDKFCILFTGRISKEKAHMVLLKAIAGSKYNDRIQLFLAGQGPLQPKIEAYGKKHLANKPIIKFYTREELVELINQMDLYCHPSVAEIEAISCLEAISCGIVPIIANSKKCATKAFALDERCLFKVNDSKDLTAKIDFFIEHPEEKGKLSHLYLKESRTFNQEECMHRMEEMFNDVISETSKK